MLKALLESGEQIVVPGVFDALSAKIASQAGFKALYMSGFAVAGTLLGKPDIGLITASEMVQRLGQIVENANDIPIIADGDTGYGGEHNVARLVHAYEQIGAQCIQLEDQVSPKRCGHMENKQVVEMSEAVSKLEMAVSSRDSADFLIMARTDSRATHDLDEAIRRGEAFLKAGADILFIEAPRSVDEMQRIANAFQGVPLVANLVEDGKTPELGMAELKSMGYQIVLRPVTALLVIARQLQITYESLYQTSASGESERLTFGGFNDLVGLKDYL